METLFVVRALNDHAPSLLSLLGLLAVKGAIVLAAAFLVTLALRRASAASRHLVWSLAFAAILLMTVLAYVLPPWPVPLVSTLVDQGYRLHEQMRRSDSMPEIATDRPSDGKTVSEPMPNPNQENFANPGLLHADQARGFTESGAPDTSPISTWPSWIIGLWIAGVAVTVARRLVGRLRVAWLTHRGHLVQEGPWIQLLHSLCDEVGVARSVRLFRSDRATVPMTWGLIKPKILLPADAETWPFERRRSVLMHEVAHIKRLDVLTQAAAQIVCSLYWFNPLVGLAYRQFVKEREHACDDFVLRTGTKPSTYASILLDLASSAQPALTSVATVAMARSSQLEGRLLAILDPRLRRTVLTRFTVAAAALVVFTVVVPLAAMRPVAESPEPSNFSPPIRPKETPTPSAMTQAALKAEPEPSSSPGVPAGAKSAPQSTASAQESAQTSQEKKSTSATKDDDTTSLVIRSLGEALSDPSLEVAVEAAETLSRIRDARALEALATALQDERREVRKAAIKALARLEDRQAVRHLLPALQDPDWEIRQYAAWALGEIEDPAAVAPLGEALTDSNLEVRKAAVEALAEIEDRRAVPALSKALTDDDWQVRHHAARALGKIEDPAALDALGSLVNDPIAEVRKAVVWALGEIEDPRAVPTLQKLLQDEHPEIRRMVVRALGEIEDPTAVPPLSEAVKDADPEVREMAAWALGEIGDPRAVGALLGVTEDSHWQIRRRAVWALGEIEDRRAVAAVVGRLSDEHREVRKTAARALGEFADPGAVDALIKGLLDTDWEVRKYAAHALGEIADPRATEPLTQALKDENKEVRRAAARALGELKWGN